MRILVYGYGKMASAMVEGWLRAGINASDITAFNPRRKETPPGIKLVTAPPESAFDIVVLGFKPHMLRDIAPQIQSLAGPGTLMVSILAGITLDQLHTAFPNAKGCVRFMPNLAVALGKSPNVLSAHELGQADHDCVTHLASMLGSAEWLEDEGLFDLATALAGSGPGFVYRVIDAFAGAASELGLPAEMSQRLSLAMVDGAAALAASSEHSPAELADRVASPGGMTREGLEVLDSDLALRRLLVRTLKATADKGSELSRNA
ncbi:MAG: pyrroline-5-carboxylate reductase [Pseudomonadota bacterium]